MSRSFIYLIMMFTFILTCTKEHPIPKWSNPVDPLGADYFPPKTGAIADTGVNINDTLFLKIPLADSTGPIKSSIWSEDSAKWDTIAGLSKPFIWFSPIDADKKVWFKVVDLNGLTSDVKKVLVHVRTRPPAINVPERIVVRWDQEATIQATAMDTNGSVVRYIWKSSADPQCDTTTSPVWEIRHSVGGKVIVTVGAIDNDGIITFAQTSVLFDRRPDHIELDYPYDGLQHIFDKMDFKDSIGSILAFGLKATDPDGADDSLRYALEVTDTVSKKTRRLNNVSGSIWIDSLFPGRWYRITFKAYDLLGDSVSNDITFLTQSFFPKGMVYFPREPQYGVNHPFWIDTTELTEAEWIHCLDPNNSDSSLVHSKKPVVSNWGAIEWFFYMLNGGVKSIGYREPLVEEWIRAYKDPASTAPYYWGPETHQDLVKKYAWYNMNAQASTWTVPHAQTEGVQDVAQLLPNIYGLYDMSGNAAEQCILSDRKHYTLSEAGKVCGGDVTNNAEQLNQVVFLESNTSFLGTRKVYGQIYR